MTTVLLVRHGATDWSEDRRLQGWTPTPLNEQGQEQAQILGTTLQQYGLDHVYSSDLLRATETTEIALSAYSRDVDISYAHGWRERDFGVLEGLNLDEMFERFPEHSPTGAGTDALLDSNPESGEHFQAFRDRIFSQWTNIMSATDHETVLIVTHTWPIRLILGRIKGWSATRSIAEGVVQNCCINEVRCDPTTGENEIVSENR